ncbi:MAG: hypothetical protein ACI8PT_003437, partial [Gammaproteobacteria bacterium]
VPEFLAENGVKPAQPRDRNFGMPQKVVLALMVRLRFVSEESQSGNANRLHARGGNLRSDGLPPASG